MKLPGDASGYVVVESNKKLKLKELTIEAFIQPTKPTGKWQGIICKQKAGCGNRNYGIWVHATNNKLSFISISIYQIVKEIKNNLEGQLKK